MIQRVCEIVSFDLDGTLVDHSFAEAVWLEGIPQLYASTKGIAFNDAQKEVKEEYDKVGKEKTRWYDLPYWIQHFNLPVDLHTLLGRFEHHITLHLEVPEVLRKLKQKGYRLIIITNAIKDFLRFEIEKVGIEPYFERSFSSTSDFGSVKTVTSYQWICNTLKVHPQKVVHIGDDPQFDFKVPQSLGILAFYLDRKKRSTTKFTVWDLEEIEEQLPPRFGT